jgi:hypothetical protein
MEVSGRVNNAPQTGSCVEIQTDTDFAAKKNIQPMDGTEPYCPTHCELTDRYSQLKGEADKNDIKVLHARS